jgi:lactate permease
MYMFISALPVATVIAVLLAGWRSLHAAALGVAVALLVIAAAFAQPASHGWPPACTGRRCCWKCC